MAKVWLEDKATWLFDLAHSDLDEDAVVKGFLKHYVLQGRSIGDVQQDLHFRTYYGDLYLESAMTSLRRALEFQIDAPPRSEMRTLEEVSMIVQAVRAGERVQVDYYDSEIDDNPYAIRAAW